MGLGADLSAPPAPTPRGPGRPPANPAARAASDAKYAAIQEAMAAMPQGAKECKFAIFEARRSVDAKRSFQPLQKLTLSKWKELGLDSDDSGALAAYCEDKFGIGRYLVEAQDPHGARIPALATWCFSTPNDEESMDDEYDDEDDRPRRPGRRFTSRFREDEEGEDPRESRHNIADVLVASARSDKSATKEVMKSSTDMMTMLMLTNQQASSQARQDAMVAEQRKHEERLEERRREEERRRDEDKRAEAKREEDRRREAEENRRREEENRRREEENRRAIEASNKRTEILITTIAGAATTLLPLLLNRRDPAQEALVAAMTKKEPDALTVMLMKTFLDTKSQPHSPLEHVIPTLIEAQKAGSAMQAEAMRGAFSMNNEITATIIKRVLDNADNGGGGGGNNEGMLQQIMGALKGAGELVNTLMPRQPPPSPYQQAAFQRRLPAPAPAPAPAAAPATGAQPQPPATAPAVPAQPTAEQIAQEEAEFQAAVTANPLLGSLVGLRAIQSNNHDGKAGYQQLVEYVVQHLPLGLRVYILDNNEAQVLAACLPTVQSNPALMEWFKDPAVLPWIRDYVPKLAPMIENLFGPAQQQRDQFVDWLSKQQPAPAAEAPAAEEAPAPAPAAEVAPAAEAPPAPAPEPSNVIPGPGASPTEQPPAAPAPASHLDADV
jgi:hypothetical protein